MYFLGIYRSPVALSMKRHFWNGCFCIVVLLAFVNLNNTYFGGYHSARQMLYGGFLGLLSHLACIYPMLKHGTRSTRQQS